MEKKLQKMSKFWILQFLDSRRFMAKSVTNLVNNLSEEIHKIKWKYRHDDKKCETCRINYNYCNCFLEYTNLSDSLM